MFIVSSLTAKVESASMMHVDSTFAAKLDTVSVYCTAGPVCCTCQSCFINDHDMSDKCGTTPRLFETAYA